MKNEISNDFKNLTEDVNNKMKNLEEASSDTVMKVARSYTDTLRNLSVAMEKYANSKLDRRINSDYAGNDKKLTEIGKAIMNADRATEKAYKEILKIVG